MSVLVLYVALGGNLRWPSGKFKGPNNGITIIWALFSVGVIVIGVNRMWVVLLLVLVGGWWMVDGG